jgi:hypothetical protein
MIKGIAILISSESDADDESRPCRARQSKQINKVFQCLINDHVNNIENMM